MNEMMIGHRRNLLAALGIDIWVPKDRPHQEKNLGSIWRDQIQEKISRSIPEQIISVREDLIEPTTPIISPDTPQPSPIPEAVVTVVPTTNIETRIPEQVEAFALQAFSLPHCVVITETTTFTEQQQRLWFNIQTAIPGQSHELKWPFPLINFQDGRGVGSYIQGFLDALCLDKTLICLGNPSYIQQAKMTRLPSLQEMLEQPLLKKQLWQLMQNNDEKMED